MYEFRIIVMNFFFSYENFTCQKNKSPSDPNFVLVCAPKCFSKRAKFLGLFLLKGCFGQSQIEGEKNENYKTSEMVASY